VLVGNLILEIKGMFLSYWLILLTTSFLANMIGLNLSSGLNSVITIYIIIPFILVPQLLFSGFTVNYDKLHKIWRNPEYVPVIGDMMTSRWAYEAMAVHQFRANKYSRNYFAEDRIIKNSSYHEFVLGQVKVRIENGFYLLQKKDTSTDLSGDFKLIRTELKTLSDQGVVGPFIDLDKFIPLHFNEQVYQTALDYLAWERKNIITVKREGRIRKDSITQKLIGSLGGREAYLKFRDEHYNERLAELLTNEHLMIESAIEVDNRLVRKKDLIYMEPTSRFGRAHFYAPEKKLGDFTLDTFLFNLIYIWITSLFFYLLLVFDAIRKIVDWTERIRLKKTN
jgi:hypothetical protein